MKMENKIALEELDLQIIRILQLDARKSFSDIASDLNVSLDVVSYRFRRLKEQGVIKGSTLLLDFKKIHQYGVILEVETDCGKEEEVIAFALQIAHPLAVGLVCGWCLGAYSISAAVFIDSMKSLESFVEKLRKNEHVIRIIVTQISDFYQVPENIDLTHLLEVKKQHE
jgi:Lrp/AsnC family transcriptional regulator for asnA, asnC and gidA